MARTQTIAVKHNMEMAHRLSQTPGKCERVHGHSWWCTLYMTGEVDRTGKVFEYGELKQVFRHYIDSQFDHRLVLNRSDELAKLKVIPGLMLIDADPTTENLAAYIGRHFQDQVGDEFKMGIELWETSVNMAKWGLCG